MEIYNHIENEYKEEEKLSRKWRKKEEENLIEKMVSNKLNVES